MTHLTSSLVFAHISTCYIISSLGLKTLIMHHNKRKEKNDDKLICISERLSLNLGVWVCYIRLKAVFAIDIIIKACKIHIVKFAVI